MSDERLDMSEMFPNDGRHYVLRVRGNGLSGKHITDGDYVVIRRQDTAKDGEMVIACVGTDVCLRIFREVNGLVRLEGADPSVEPICGDVQVQGVVVGVLRKMQRAG